MQIHSLDAAGCRKCLEFIHSPEDQLHHMLFWFKVPQFVAVSEPRVKQSGIGQGQRPYRAASQSVQPVHHNTSVQPISQ